MFAPSTLAIMSNVYCSLFIIGAVFIATVLVFIVDGKPSRCLQLFVWSGVFTEQVLSSLSFGQFQDNS